MADILRHYQRSALTQCQQAWAEGDEHVMVVIPTGGGKSVLSAQAAAEHDGDGMMMAHRSELVGQLSLALARAGIVHNLCTSAAVRRTIQMAHYEQFDRSFISTSADWYVGSVDTIIRRDIPPLRKPLIIQDEGHHTLRDNKWGKALSMLPSNKRVLLPTATPLRGDKKGLGRHASGVVDRMIIGPSTRDLINDGMLTDYDVMAPNGDIDLSHLRRGKDGDFSRKHLSEVISDRPQIIGDIVDHYRTFAMGKLAVCFTVDILHASTITRSFVDAGIPAELVSGTDDEATRRAALKRFRERETLVLVNVDLFGEGFDLPAIEVVIMARPTDSFGLYSQQWGRVLRLMIEAGLMSIWDTFTGEQRRNFIAGSSKPHGLILDHAGNLMRHNGPPDRPQQWTLDDIVKRKDEERIIQICADCARPFDILRSVCPHCATDTSTTTVFNVASKDNLKAAKGDLKLFSPEALAEMRKEIIDPQSPVHVPRSLMNTPAEVKIKTQGKELREAHAQLRLAMAYWAGMYPDMSQRDKQRTFQHSFGISAINALALRKKECLELLARIRADIESRGYVLHNLHLADNFRVDAGEWMASELPQIMRSS